MFEADQQQRYSAWNPGIESEIPAEFRELETIYDRRNVFTTLDEVNQTASDTGLSALELIGFRPHRLVLHELIVRITADIVVPEGEAEEDLGITFRAIASTILDRYIEPQLSRIEQTYADDRARLDELTRRELDSALAQLSPARAPAPTLWQRMMGSRPKPVVAQQPREERELALINRYQTLYLESNDEYLAAVYRSLHRVFGAIARTRGLIGNDLDFLLPICLRHAVNYLASKHIGRAVAGLVDKAVDSEGYRRIPDADRPVLISLKGASASGKSHLRPMLRDKLSQHGIGDYDYGTISPDIWRKLLLDYESLGPAYKYAGRFTSHEVSIIDAKLDRYIRAKAKQRQSIPHLVVDRFRFDSFASEKIARVLHKTYVHHVDTMYMYFIVTPPEATVERGWARGLERGRYKAVEDYLAHCVEAYAGMPKLLFKWLANEKPRYSFKFMDNSGPKDAPPSLIARGAQGWMQLFEPERFIDIERFKRINILATSPEQVAAAPEDLVVTKNLGFLRQCIDRIAQIEFVDPASDKTYLSIQQGRFEVVDREMFRQKLGEDSLRDIMTELAPDLLKD